MLRILKKVRQAMTIIVVSDDINKHNKTFRLPNFITLSFLVCTTLPFIFLGYFVHSHDVKSQLHKEQVKHSEKLEAELHKEKEKNSILQSQLSYLEEESDHYLEKLTELESLEQEIRNHIEKLPISLAARGGPDIQPTNEAVAVFNEEESDFQRDFSIHPNALVKKYENTLLDVVETNEQLQYIPTIWPADNRKITSDFGKRSDPFTKRSSLHMGVDIRGYWGDPVYASADGKVKLSQYHGGYGQTIILNHGNGYETLYAHMRKLLVNENDNVKKGDLIGHIGSTGRSTGPHLHFEIHDKSNPIDPVEFLEPFLNE